MLPKQFLFTVIIILSFFIQELAFAEPSYLALSGQASVIQAKHSHTDLKKQHPKDPRPNLTLWKQRPFYFGAIVGYGSTDWSKLVISCDPADPLCDPTMLSVSAPISAGDDGAVWGATIGFEVKPFWALEATYIRFPTTVIHLDKSYTFYSSVNPLENAVDMSSETWAYILVAKFMTRISNSGFRGFANAGVDFTERKDIITSGSQVSATFGVGVNYVFQTHVMLELFFQYVAGYGRSNEKPVKYYIPFLYALGVKLMYRL